MNLPTPFAYPTTPHMRRHGPLGYENYQNYKPFLRDEFTFRCVYCLERETWYPNREASFSTDHFEPPEGRKLIALLDLANAPAVEVREETLLLLRAKREQPDNPVIHALFLKRFKYPTDLPDLARLKPPGGNSRPDGIEESHHARQQRGELPEVY
jgi:hypothetical protein